MLVWITSGKEKGGSVLKSIYKLSGYFAVLAWSGMVSATGLGGINVSSSLGQPLKAEIELVSVDKSDSSSISAKLASPDSFKSAGVDYPYALPKLKFEVINRDSGSPSIKLTSSQPVNDPFVTLLIEVTWSSGKLLREYTFLLDPVDFKAQEPQPAPVKTIAPVVAAPVVPATPVVPVAVEPVPVVTQPAAPAPVETQPEQVAPAPADTTQQAPSQPEAVAPAPVEQTVPVPEQAAPAEVSPAPVVDALSKEEALPVAEPEVKPIAVVRGDTLSKIALKSKPADVSLERMLVALYRANTDAFVGKNMNRLKTGKIIRLPEASDLDAVQQAEAVKEVRAQVADWNVYRQQLAAVKTEAGSDTAKQASSGKINTAVAESASSKAPAKEVLKLSKGEAPGDKAAGGGKASAQEKANAKEEESIAKNKALKEAQDRTALLEKNVKDLQRLAELKKQAEAATAMASAASAPAPAVAASAPAVVTPKVVAPEPKVVEQASLLDDPIMLAGGVAGLLALAGVGFMLTRRNKKSGGKDKAKEDKSVAEDVGGATGRIAAPVMPSPDTGDFTQSANTESTAQINSDEVDPIGEADLFLTFGRDVQAEEVLTEALKSNPNNLPVRLKLLSIYVARKDTNSFFTHAKVIKESGDDAAWAQAAAMGLALEPSNPLYGGDGVATTPAVEQPTEAAQPSVDFDLGFGAPAAPVQVAPDFQGTVVLETPSNESTTILSASDLRAAQETPMDFDVTGTHPGIPAVEVADASPAMHLDEMDFDVTSTHPGIPAQSAAANASDVPAENVDDLIFDVTTTHASSPAAEKPAAPPADEGGLAFTLDFPTDFKVPASVKEPAPVDIGLGDISLNLGSIAPAAAASSESKDDRWQEVATKLDLAKAYQEMGDAAGAKEILDEVLRDGDAEQRASAEAMMQQL
ncbi:MAG: pilus assembly protein FimV [Gallionellaceae bacterium]|nr:MAG: pilus assembly protein FimV [Gallionellaceae bacterium]